MSVLSDKIVVKSIRVESPEITFEGNPFGANNLKKIQDNVNTAAANFQSPLSTNQPPKTAAPAKPGKKLEVDEFLITGAKIHFGTGPTLPLPDIHLTDLGKGPDGITPADLTKQVLSEVVSGTIKAVGSAADQHRQGRRQDRGRGREQNHLGPRRLVQEINELNPPVPIRPCRRFWDCNRGGLPLESR